MNILEYAIRMESDGEAFYSQQTRLNKYNSIGVVSSLLAEAENSHARLLREKSVELEFLIPDDTAVSSMDKVFKNLGNVKGDIAVMPTQLDFYRKAMELERKSINFYTGLYRTSDDQDERSVFEFLIEQEKCHLALLGDLSELLRNSFEWVDSAELGLRREAY